jgi:TetR/AcrR family transcriptional regulator
MPLSVPREGSDVPVEEVRHRIVVAALCCFAEKGYAGTSLREIAEAARTTKPMIYYYFKSKEGLYLSMLGDLLQQFGEQIDLATHHDDGPLEKLRSFCDTYLRYFQSQEPHVAFIVREVFGLGADVTSEFGKRLDERIQSRLLRVLEDGVASGIFRDGDLECCSVAIMGILNMFILRRIFGGEELNRDAAVAQVMDYYVAGLRATEIAGMLTPAR